MLKEQIQKDILQAVKEGNKIVSSSLRFLLAVILTREKDKRYKLSKEDAELSEQDLDKQSNLTEEEVIEVVSSEVKKGKEAMSEFKKGNRDDLVEKETAEIEVLQKYLPEQLPKEELEKIVKEAVEKTNAKEMKDMGKVMAELMPKVKGKADGGEVSSLVKEALSS